MEHLGPLSYLRSQCYPKAAVYSILLPIMFQFYNTYTQYTKIYQISNISCPLGVTIPIFSAYTYDSTNGNILYISVELCKYML